MFVTTNGALIGDKMFEEGPTVVGDKVPEVIQQEYNLKKLSSWCTICRKKIKPSLDIDTPFAPTHPQFTTILSFFNEF